MTAWATASDIPDRYGDDFYVWIADRDKDEAVSGDDLTAVNKALESATSYFRSMIGSKYAIDDTTGMPAGIDTLPEFLVDAVVDVAVYKLAGYDASALTEEHKERYKMAMQVGRDIGKGIITLGIASPPSTVGTSTVLSSSSRTKRFEDTSGMF